MRLHLCTLLAASLLGIALCSFTYNPIEVYNLGMPKVTREFGKFFLPSGQSSLAFSCYVKINYTDLAIGSCIAGALYVWRICEGDSVKHPLVPMPIDKRTFNNTKPWSCYAFRTIIDCVNDYACYVCTYEEAQAFLEIRKSWLDMLPKLCPSVSSYPPNATIGPPCQPNMSRTTTAPATWGTVRLVKPGHAQLYIIIGTLVLFALLFGVICCAISHKKTEVLESTVDKSMEMILVDANQVNSANSKPKLSSCMSNKR